MKKGAKSGEYGRPSQPNKWTKCLVKWGGGHHYVEEAGVKNAHLFTWHFMCLKRDKIQKQKKAVEEE